jgi:methionine-rich copper-binding protein CopC
MRSAARLRAAAGTIRQVLGIVVGAVALTATAPAAAWAAPAAPATASAVPGSAPASAPASAALTSSSSALFARSISASAHTELRASKPRANSRVSEVPHEVVLEFSKPVRGRLSQVVVNGPDGVRYELGAAHSVAKTVRQLLRPLALAGDYRFNYRAVADDGHPLVGTIRFTLTRPGPGVAGAAGSAGAGKGPAPAAPSHAQAPAGLATGGNLAPGARPSGGPVTRYPAKPTVRPAESTRAAAAGGVGGVQPWALVIAAIVAAVVVTGIVIFCRRVTRDIG